MDIELLRKLRKEAKLNQSELGKMLGVSSSTIGMYEQGRRRPDHNILVQLSEIFNVSVDVLLGVKEKEKQQEIDKNEITSQILKNLAQQDALMFSAGDMSTEDYKKIEQAIEIAVEMAVKKSKA